MFYWQINVALGALSTAVITYFVNRHLQEKYPSKSEKAYRDLLLEMEEKDR